MPAPPGSAAPLPVLPFFGLSRGPVIMFIMALSSHDAVRDTFLSAVSCSSVHRAPFHSFHFNTPSRHLLISRWRRRRPGYGRFDIGVRTGVRARGTEATSLRRE